MSFFISFLAGVALFYSSQYFLLTSSIVFLFYLAVLIFKKRYLLIPVLALGVLYAFFRYAPEADFSSIRGKEVIVSGAFGSDAVLSSTGKFIQEFRVSKAVAKDTRERLKEIDGEDIFIFSDSEFDTASRKGYEIEIRIGRDNRKFNPGMTGNNNLYANLIGANKVTDNTKGIWAVFEGARLKLNRHISENFSDDSGALIAAITTGHRGNMSEGLKDAFNSTGLAHILSISGTHFGIFSVLLFGIFRLIIKFLPYSLLQRITLYITPSQGAAALSLPFMLAYLALSGWSIPAVRSFIMISLFLIGLLIGRKRFWLNSLLFAAFVIVLWNPEALFSLSFQLSFLAVLFIGFSAEIGKEEEQQSSRAEGQQVSKTSALLRHCAAVLRSSVLLTLAASLGTAPLVAYHFHYFSVISPLSNLIITPLIGFVLLPLSLLSSFVFLFTGQYVFGGLSALITDITLYLVRFMAGIPFADIKVPAFPLFAVISFYAGFGFYFFVSKKKLILAIASILMIASLSAHIFLSGREMGITYLDVGQGDGAVIELPDRKVIVMDAGKSGREVSAFLKYRGIKTIDALALSHADFDHAGGAGYLKARFKVKELWDSGRIIHQEAGSRGMLHRVLERGDVIEGNGYKIYALHPYKEFYAAERESDNGGNNSSLVLKIEGGNKSFLFTGDVEEEAQENIVHLGKWLESDVVKVPHHGGRTSAYKPFYDVISPEIAVISAGRDNAFGHPHYETLEMLDGVKIYRTDINGAVKITEKDGKLQVKTYRDFIFLKTRTLEGEMRNIERLFRVW